MPLATAVTILYLAPIFTVIFAIVLVKEWPGKWQWPFFILCFIGAALLKNFDPRVSMVHFSMGIIAAMFAGIAYNMIRLLKNKAHHSLVIFYFPFVTIPLLSPWIYNYWVTPNLVEFLLLLGIGVSTQLAQVFMTKAYMLESAAKISHFNYLTCFFAFLTGIIFFDESLNTYSLIGLSLILIGIIFSSKFAPRN
jgi:drug/metabolite transporter (DMT)-like permease